MKLTLIDKKQETRGVTTYIFEPAENIEWEAGQYLHYVLPHDNADDRKDERWFTISSAPFEKHIQITTRHAERSSSFKRALAGLPVGSTIEADGLEGDFVLKDPDTGSVFIAGGIGITPFRSILLDLDHRGLPINVKLLYANRDDDFPFREELDLLTEKHPGFSISYFVEPERIDEAAIRAEAPDLRAPIFFVSGPVPMVEAYKNMLGGMGVPEDRIKLDDFPGYEGI